MNQSFKPLKSNFLTIREYSRRPAMSSTLTNKLSRLFDEGRQFTSRPMRIAQMQLLPKLDNFRLFLHRRVQAKTAPAKLFSLQPIRWFTLNSH
ncbi:MAG TPA: hypothetical protein VFV23_13750 [Verrucomicrobiae bacterium]|nr:hypothetical protein [Verrucomicrobiae bacterium]